jgi:hypothetical protein
MNAALLIQDLVKLTQENRREALAFKDLSDEVLNFKQDAETWSVLECIEHLNRYGDFYIPEISKRLNKSKYPKSTNFKTGWLGNYFAKSMLPKEKLNKIKTFGSMNPNNSTLDRGVLDKFIRQQDALIDLLEQAKITNLTKIKTAISISKWIKLRLGDTFRVVINHNLRHIVQAKRCVEQVRIGSANNV